MVNAPPVLHEQVLDQMIGLYKEGRLGHAILLTGPEGIGKYECVQSIAHHLLGGPTDVLDHPDLIHCHCPEDKKSLGIDQIRELTEQSQQTTHQGHVRVIIISEAETMTPSAANALLKTLEEPGPQNHFFLITAYPKRLPMTIRSRCQSIQLYPPSHDEARAWLGGMIPDVADADLDRLMFFAFAKPTLALRIHQDNALSDYEAAWEAVTRCFASKDFNPWPVLQLNHPIALLAALKQYTLQQRSELGSPWVIASAWAHLSKASAQLGGHLNAHVSLTLFRLLNTLFTLFHEGRAYAVR